MSEGKCKTCLTYKDENKFRSFKRCIVHVYSLNELTKLIAKHSANAVYDSGIVKIPKR